MKKGGHFIFSDKEYKEIVYARFVRKMSLQDVAKKYKTSRLAIRELEVQELRKMRLGK